MIKVFKSVFPRTSQITIFVSLRGVGCCNFITTSHTARTICTLHPRFFSHWCCMLNITCCWASHWGCF